MSVSVSVEEKPVRRRSPARIARFLRVVLGVTALTQVPVALGVAEAGRRLALSHAWALGAAWAIAGLALFAGRARAGMPDRRRGVVVPWLVDLPYFVHWCASIWTLLGSLVATLVFPIVDLARGAPVSLPMGFYMGAYASGLAVSAYGVFVRRRWFRVVEIDVPVAGLAHAFDGYRIAQLSDLHIGTLTPKSWGERWARAANRHTPDLAVVTGDLVTSGTDFHGDVASVVGALRAKDGVFASMGNHDYFGEGEPLITMLREAGVRVLRNEGTLLERGGAKLWLAGIDDTWTRRDDLARALRDRPDGAPTLLLAHDPARFAAAAREGVELTLSGHTHGGQIALPFVYRWASLATLGHKFNVGLYRNGRSTLYVHPGLGTTGPPVRLGVAPAVVILTLRAA
jgi:predicted MPP superfamily phosphohydrolase